MARPGVGAQPLRCAYAIRKILVRVFFRAPPFTYAVPPPPLFLAFFVLFDGGDDGGGGCRFGGSEASTEAALEALKTPLGASLDPEVAESELRGGREEGVGGGVLGIMHGRSRTTIDPRTPHNAGTEHVGFLPTIQILLAPSDEAP